MADRYVPDLYDLAHVAVRELYDLHDLEKVSWNGSVQYRSYTTYHIGRLGYKLSRS